MASFLGPVPSFLILHSERHVYVTKIKKPRDEVTTFTTFIQALDHVVQLIIPIFKHCALNVFGSIAMNLMSMAYIIQSLRACEAFHKKII